MIRVLFLLLAILCCGHAHAATYVCTNTTADTAPLNAVLANGGYVHIVGHCDHVNATILFSHNGTVVFGDGAENITAPNGGAQATQTLHRLLPTAQSITANSGTTTSISADPAAELASPFNVVTVSGDGIYISDMTINGNYLSIAQGPYNTPGAAESGVYCSGNVGTVYNSGGSVASIGGARTDRIEVFNVGGSDYNYSSGHDCAATNSVGHTSWHDAFYTITSSGSYWLNDVFTDASRGATYGSSFGYWDMGDCDPNHVKCVTAQSSIYGGDVLETARLNTTQIGGPDTEYQNWHDNTSTVPTCTTLGESGSPQVDEVLGFQLTVTRPGAASPSTASYTYTVTPADVAAADPLYSVMQNVAAIMNASPVSVGGTTILTMAWQAGNSTTFTHAFEWRLPANLSCVASITTTDTGSPQLVTNPGTIGAANGSGGCATRNGTEGPYWDVENECYVSRHYGINGGGSNISAHVVGNWEDSFPTAGYRNGVSTSDGSPVGAQVGNFLLNNYSVTPNVQCSGVGGCTSPAANAVVVNVGSPCGSWKFTGTPVLGETLAMTMTVPGASNSPQTYNYTVTSFDISTGNALNTVAGNIATAYNANQIVLGGATIGGINQREGAHATFASVKFTLGASLACTETLSYTNTVPSAISIQNIPASATGMVLGSAAGGNVGGPQIYPNIGPYFWGFANQTGDWPPVTQGEQQAKLASTFVDSIGVNGSGNAAIDGPLLAYTGIKHVRLQAGVTGQTAAQISAYSATIAKVLEMQAYCFCNIPPTGAGSEASWVTNYVDPVTAGVVEAIGGENEVALASPDSYNGSSIANAAGAVPYQLALYSAVKGDGSCVPAQPIACPTFSTVALPVATFTLGIGVNSAGWQVDAYSDIDDRHCYAANTASAAGTLSYCLLYEVLAPGKPGWVTEAGVSTIPSNFYQGVDQTTQARYDLRFLFDAPLQNVQRVYLYNLQDYGPTIPPSTNFNNYFGLFQNNGTSSVLPKTSATAIKNLTTILERNPAGGTLQVPGTLAYTLSGMPSDAYSLLLEQPGGVYDLVLWQDGTSWNPSNGSEISLGSHSVTVTLPTAAAVNAYDPITSSSPTQTFSSGTSVTVTLGDDPIIVEVE